MKTRLQKLCGSRFRDVVTSDEKISQKIPWLD